jgi:hypothetical protein
VEPEIQTHEKIRFRRDEICDLSAFPSALGQEVPRAPRSARRGRLPQAGRILRTAARSLAVLLGLLVFAIAGLYAVGASGIGTERLRLEAEAALRRAAGPDVAAAIGPAHISLDGARLLALNISDFKLTAEGKSQVEAGTLQFGVRLLPLFGGEFKLGSAKISDARILASALVLGRTGDWTAPLRNEDGLIDPDVAGEALFNVLHSALDLLERGGTRRIDLENTELVLSDTGRIRSLMISEASLALSGSGVLTLSVEGSLDGREVSLAGSAVHDSATQRIAELELDLTVAPSEPLVLDSQGLLSTDGSKSRMGSAGIEIRGEEKSGDTPSRLTFKADIENSVIDMGRRGVVPGDAEMGASLVIGANKIEIERLSIATGRSRIEATGALGPQPRDASNGQPPAYRYEFVTERALLSPLDSPDSPTEFSARMAGRFDEHTMLLTADELAIRTGEGQLVGMASVEFVRGTTPGLALALSASDMPVAQVKQFWPWLAAGKARQWVLENFFGGRVAESQIRYRVAPGRIGDGVPLRRDELFGRFEVKESRFDTTGALPPIRDANGVIEFHGNDVDISLSTGNAYLPSGKKIAVSNGVLTFRNANINPVIGDLDLDLEGEAVAIAELASLEPINAMRRLDMNYADFSGRATGHVKTQLPLQKNTDIRKLEWQVKLDVADLDIAKPFDGQKITSANGTITVDPRQAVLDLDGLLNDIPAKLNVVEPLREDGPARVRDIELTVDDKRRNQLAPGLDDMVAGTMVLDVDASGEKGRQKVTADLTKAKLSIPWVGWSKGSGVPAKVSFAMTRDGSNATLADFELSGESFAISGDVKLANGALSSARFDRVRLNRNDSARVDIARRGRAYSVTVNGDTFDARSLIKLVLGDSGDGGSSGAASSVAVKASIGTLTGFHGEALSNVKLSYSGPQKGAASYALSAATSNGGSVSVDNEAEGGQQVMRVRSADAGAFVRFLDIYDKMQGGQVDLVLRGGNDGPMRGQINATDFQIVNESRLGSIVSTKPTGGDRSLSQAVRRDIDTARVQFQRGFARVEKGGGYLTIDGGVLRGPMVGATFQGMLYDKNGNIDMTGTFMPAYGLNRLFGELPIIGILLGNGRDRGLIGVTFKLEGKAAKPQLQINPLSVIAPGIFRSIFEFQ